MLSDVPVDVQRIQKALSGDCFCEGTTEQGFGLRVALNSFMSKNIDLRVCEARGTLSLLSSLFERMHVGSI